MTQLEPSPATDHTQTTNTHLFSSNWTVVGDMGCMVQTLGENTKIYKLCLSSFIRDQNTHGAGLIISSLTVNYDDIVTSVGPITDIMIR